VLLLFMHSVRVIHERVAREQLNGVPESSISLRGAAHEPRRSTWSDVFSLVDDDAA